MSSSQKRLSVLFLCVILTVTTLTGCGGGNALPTETLTPPPTETPTPTEPTTAPPTVNPVEPITETPTTALSSGGYYYMAVDNTGNALMWGQNEWTMFVHESGGAPPDNPIYKLKNARSVSANIFTAVVVDQSNVLWGWGQGYTFIEWDEINKGAHVLLMTDVAMACSGGTYCVALKTNGEVYCWGRGPLEESEKLIPVDQAIKVLDNSIYVYAGSGSCYAIQEDGSLWRWSRSVLNEGLTSANKPVKVMDDVVYVNESLALKKDGTLWGWKPERGSYTTSFEPVLMMENVVFCDSAHDGFAAILNDGSLWLWGNNQYGQIGDGTTETRDEPVKVANNVVDVTVDIATVYFIDNNGNLWETGRYHLGIDFNEEVTPDLLKPRIVASGFMGQSGS